MSPARRVGAFRDPLMEEARFRRPEALLEGLVVVVFCVASVGRGIATNPGNVERIEFSIHIFIHI